MKALKLVAFGLIALLVLSPVISQADTEDTAAVTLTLTDVINIDIDDTGLSDVTVTQSDLASWYGIATEMYRSFGNFDVQIIALTDFNVVICQDASGGQLGAYPLGDENQVLQLTDGTGTVIDWIPDCDSGTFGISTDFTQANNTPGETEDYDLEVYLDNLGDRVAGEAITFTVKVTVSDPTT